MEDAVPEAQRDYGPGALEWVVDVALDGGTISTSEVDAVFDDEWREEVGGTTLYGMSAEEGRWTYLHAGDSPTVWTKIAVAVDLVRTYGEDPAPRTAVELKRFSRAVGKRGAGLGSVEVSSRTSPQIGAALAHEMFDCWREARADSLAILEAPEGDLYDGQEVWDVMMCLGLRWGDGDLFHWTNESDVGHDSLFSVWTTTEPGFFFPEEIAEGRMNPEDLIFGFNIARCAEPEHCHRQMMNAVKYARERLGGTVVDRDGDPLSRKAERERVQRVVRRLAAAGLEPGRETTLCLM